MFYSRSTDCSHGQKIESFKKKLKFSIKVLKFLKQKYRAKMPSEHMLFLSTYKHQEIYAKIVSLICTIKKTPNQESWMSSFSNLIQRAPQTKGLENSV